MQPVLTAVLFTMGGFFLPVAFLMAPMFLVTPTFFFIVVFGMAQGFFRRRRGIMRLEDQAAGDGVGGLNADDERLAYTKDMLAALAFEAGMAFVVIVEIARQVAGGDKAGNAGIAQGD